MDINLASLAGNLNAPKRSDREQKQAVAVPSRKGGLRRAAAAAFVLLAVVGL